MAGRMKTAGRGDHLKFLGTAGARFVMIKQLRASGGMWVSCAGANVLIDPGPGSIVRLAKSRPKIDPSSLDAVILTHRHLDHCGDVNVMIEAMTEGGFKKRGVVFCPEDAITRDAVILEYIRKFPERIELLKAGASYSVNGFAFETSMRHVHPVETYGLKFKINSKSVGLVADTKYFKGLEDFYRCDILIIGVVFPEPRPAIEHLSADDAVRIISAVRPRKAVITHFGMGMLKAGPDAIAERLSRESGVEVQAAYDGMTLEF